MRVIAGSAKRIQLKTIDGLNTRPTTDRIKETLFNMISEYLADSIFLDLFSGSGGIGIEALSRGAAYAVFVENSKKAAACIEDNIHFTKFDTQSRLLTSDALTAIHTLEGKYKFDIIFMDPPYQKDLEKQVLLQLSNSGLLKEDSLIIVEADLDTSFDYVESYGFEVLKFKRYKTNMHVFLQKKAEETNE